MPKNCLPLEDANYANIFQAPPLIHNPGEKQSQIFLYNFQSIIIKIERCMIFYTL